MKSPKVSPFSNHTPVALLQRCEGGLLSFCKQFAFCRAVKGLHESQLITLTRMCSTIIVFAGHVD